LGFVQKTRRQEKIKSSDKGITRTIKRRKWELCTDKGENNSSSVVFTQRE